MHKIAALFFLFCIASIAGCEKITECDQAPCPPADNTTENPQQDTTPASTGDVPPPLMFIAGYWKGPCVPMLPVYVGNASVAYRIEYLFIGVDGSANVEQFEEGVYSDDQCTTLYEGTWPDTATEIPLSTDINITNFINYNYALNFDYYQVGNALTTPSGAYAMEVDMTLGGNLASNQYSSLVTFGQNYIYKNIFSITDAGYTLLFGTNHEQDFYNCLVANQDYLQDSQRYLEYTNTGYEGLTLWDQTNLGTANYDTITTQTYAGIQSTDPTYEYGFDLNLAANIQSGGTMFLQAYPFPVSCQRPTELDTQRRYTRIARPDWY
jgi:hypothetical protein